MENLMIAILIFIKNSGLRRSVKNIIYNKKTWMLPYIHVFFVFLFRYSSHFQDNLFPTFAATNAIIKPRQAAMLMAMRRPVASASHPITGGPTRKPKKLMLETMVMAMLALMVPSFPAML